jgi:hypothetical protein
LDSLRLVGLTSRAVQGLLFALSFLGFLAAVYAHAGWLQNLGAVVGIGLGLTGFVGLWLGRRARGRMGSLYYKK